MLAKMEDHAMEQYNILKDRSTAIIQERDEDMQHKEREVVRLANVLEGIRKDHEEELQKAKEVIQQKLDEIAELKRFIEDHKAELTRKDSVIDNHKEDLGNWK